PGLFSRGAGCPSLRRNAITFSFSQLLSFCHEPFELPAILFCNGKYQSKIEYYFIVCQKTCSRMIGILKMGVSFVLFALNYMQTDTKVINAYEKMDQVIQ
ncbi:hypothetical protein, partial [Natronospira sp.]|uniref:hypothetical protein n=1 Tax=Natronospira sp. TaxID=2024970 RepID=UPI003873553F